MTTFPLPVSQEGSRELQCEVTFDPPLSIQRHDWVTNVLRKERVTRVLDVGCGKGQLLSLLCEPAPWLSSPPNHLFSLPSKSSHSLERTTVESHSLHLTELHGVDISSADLGFAVNSTAPHNGRNRNHRLPLTHIPVRWEELEVKVWNGGLETVNEEFLDIECIASIEVIEHLPQNVFDAFAPTLLGIYQPRLLLITTPSYTFNARFVEPRAPNSARRGYPDPSGQTERIFRHSDHKFEWTVDEFRSWCLAVEHEWGYTVEMTSIGKAVEADRWGRDEELGGATSVAVFRRQEMNGREAKARLVLQVLQPREVPHTLLATHRHLAHPMAKQPSSLDEISLAVRMGMEDLGVGTVTVGKIWLEGVVSALCGGWTELLFRAVEQSEFLAWKTAGQAPGNDEMDWFIELIPDGDVADPKVPQSKGRTSTSKSRTESAVVLEWRSGLAASAGERCHTRVEKGRVNVRGTSTVHGRGLEI